MLHSMKELLERADKDNYAVAAPNVSSELDARAALEVAEELNSPIILDIAVVSTPDLVFAGRYISELCKMSKVPVALNLDHGSRFDHAIQAIRGGFTSVMVDRSMLPYDENVAEVREIVKIAHSVGISVEAELGHVGSGADVNRAEEMFTDPILAARFIKETGVDCLAVAIGTAHGEYKKAPKLDFDRLVSIKELCGRFPLVLHGSSGSGDENIGKACRLGINKVNIANELFQGACKKLLAADLNGNGAYELWNLAKEGYKEALKNRMQLYGCIGRAWTVKNDGIGKSEIILNEA
jgi:fructose-bisphosphate aldolase class II